MKKVLAIVLMLTMVLSVVGCQANGNNDVKPTQAPEASAVVKSHIVYRLCNHMVYTLSLIQPGVIVQEIALFECVNSLVQVDAADSELSEHQCDLPRERRLANGDAFPTKPFA